jgi:hypothetical protein
MKSALLIIAALLMITLAKPASAMSVDHDSNYADASGGSRFSDPDDALGGDSGNSNPLGTMQFGNANSGGVTFGMFAAGGNNGQSGSSVPGYAMQGCLSPVCQH